MDSNTEATPQETARGYVIGGALSLLGLLLWELFSRLAWVNGNYSSSTEACQVLRPYSDWDWDAPYSAPYFPAMSTCTAEKSVGEYAPHFLSADWTWTHLIGFGAMVVLALVARFVWWLTFEGGPQLSYEITDIVESAMDTKN